MGYRIIRNDITRMQVDAIVNTANAEPIVGAGCDNAVYAAAGREELLAYRKENIGVCREGDVFVTPGFRLPAKYILHAVSPLYIDGESGEEELLRQCYRKALHYAHALGIRSIAFPLISTGSFGYPRIEGLRIALDEINDFLLQREMTIYIVVFDEESTDLGKRISPDLKAYVDSRYVDLANQRNYGIPPAAPLMMREESVPYGGASAERQEARASKKAGLFDGLRRRKAEAVREEAEAVLEGAEADSYVQAFSLQESYEEDIAHLEDELKERMQHLSDGFGEYLLYLMESKNRSSTQVYKDACIDKKIFSKVKNNKDYHPTKLTALCLCVGAHLNLDETKDLLARAGYALSPCDKTDIIFEYFIKEQIYDMLELDIQLGEYGLPQVIK